MVRGYWSPTGSLESIYSEADIVRNGADSKVTTWLEDPTWVAGLDPSYAHGGDKAALCIGRVGRARDLLRNEDLIVFEEKEMILLDNDITDTSIAKEEWIVRLCKQYMLQYGIKPENLAIDATGGGQPFAGLLRREIGTGFLNVSFQGAPSDMRVSRADKRTGRERFVNMASELWYVGKELIRSGQIKGLDPDTVTEMTARTYKETAGKVAIEAKVQMKARTRKSPDRSDALFLAIHVARMRHGLSSSEKAARKATTQNQPKTRHEIALDMFNTKKSRYRLLFSDRQRVYDESAGWAQKNS
jgi:hypothetical protein